MTTPHRPQPAAADPAAAGPAAAAEDILALTQALMAAMAAADLTEAEWQQGDFRLHLRRAAAPLAPAAEILAPEVLSPKVAAPKAPASDTAIAAPQALVIGAPFHGIFYAAAEAGGAPLVALGQEVAEGQPLALIEAMKTFTPLPAPCAGRILAILAESGQEVTPETALFQLVPA